MIPGFPSLNCVDMSRWGGELTEEEADCLWQRGVRHIIVGVGHPNGAGMFAHQQGSTWLRVNGARGGTLDAYIYLYFAGDPEAQVELGSWVMGDLSVRCWWQDAEDVESPWLSPAQRIAFLWRALWRTEAAGLRTGIYTGGWWQDRVGYTSEFGRFDLWDSYYPRGASPENVVVQPWAGRAYGGYSEPVIYQFAGTTELCGQSVDLNWARVLEDDMADPRIDQLVKALFGSDAKLAAAAAAGDEPLWDSVRTGLEADSGDGAWLGKALAEIRATVGLFEEQIEVHVAGHPTSALAPGTEFTARVT